MSRFPNKSIGLVLLLVFGILRPAGAEPAGLSSDDLYRLARENSSAILILDTDEARARHKVQAAKSMKYPSLSYSGSYSFLALPPEGVTLQPGELGTIPDLDGPGPATEIPLPAAETVVVEDTGHNYFTLGLTFTQPLYTWGKLNRAVRAAEAGERISAAALEGGQALLRAELNTMLYSLAMLDAMEEVLFQQEKIVPRLENITEKGVAEGFLLDGELLEARILSRQVALARLELENRRQGLLDRLEDLTGLESLTPGQLILPAPEEDRPLPEQTVLLARLSRNTDLKQLTAVKEAQQELLEAASRNKSGLPDMGFQFSLEYARDSLPWMEDDWTSGFSATATLSLQGNVGGKNRAEWEIARDDETRAALQYNEALLALQNELKSALRERKLLELKMETEDIVGEKLAREADIKRNEWLSGTVGEEEYLKKELELYQSSLTYKSYWIDYHNLTERIIYLTGGGL